MNLLACATVEPERERELPPLERDEPGARLDVFLEDRLGRLRRDFLDVHAPGRRRHHDRTASGAVEHEAQVELARDREAFLDEHARHHTPFRPGLVRLQRHADQIAGDAFGLVRVFGELHAAALAAPAGVNLGLDDDRAAAKAARDLGRFGRRERDLAFRERHTVTRKNGFGLVLVDFHGGDPDSEMSAATTRS